MPICKVCPYAQEGSFKNYVDKIRWVVGKKCPFLSTFSVKNVHVEVGRWKGKMLPKYVVIE